MYFLYALFHIFTSFAFFKYKQANSHPLQAIFVTEIKQNKTNLPIEYKHLTIK